MKAANRPIKAYGGVEDDLRWRRKTTNQFRLSNDGFRSTEVLTCCEVETATGSTSAVARYCRWKRQDQLRLAGRRRGDRGPTDLLNPPQRHETLEDTDERLGKSVQGKPQLVEHGDSAAVKRYSRSQLGVASIQKKERIQARLT